MPSEMIDIRGQVHTRTDDEILFSNDGDRSNAVWLPMAQIDVGELRHGVGTVTMPKRLADSARLI